MAQVTNDYKKFKLLPGNREINPGHLRELSKSIALYPELLSARPILVNQDMQIIDGQHRFTACQSLGMPIHYEIESGLDAQSAIALNVNQRNWNLMDYAKSYADSGNKHYQTFLEIAEEYSIAPNIISNYLRGSAVSDRAKNFREGGFEIGDLKEARKYLDWLQDLIALNKSFRLTKVSMPTLAVFKHEEYDHTRMLQKMTMYGDTAFSPYGTYRDIVRSLEDVYNFRQHKDIARF